MFHRIAYSISYENSVVWAKATFKMVHQTVNPCQDVRPKLKAGLLMAVIASSNPVMILCMWIFHNT